MTRLDPGQSDSEGGANTCEGGVCDYLGGLCDKHLQETEDYAYEVMADTLAAAGDADE